MTATWSPRPVTRTFQNNTKILVNFHSTRVTPGHVYYRPDSKMSYKYETLIDVLRDDGLTRIKPTLGNTDISRHGSASAVKRASFRSNKTAT